MFVLKLSGVQMLLLQLSGIQKLLLSFFYKEMIHIVSTSKKRGPFKIGEKQRIEMSSKTRSDIL